MVNNLINYYFYDIKKQWNCTGIFLAVQQEYDKIWTGELKTATSDQNYVTHSGEWIVVPSHLYLDFCKIHN
jgi:hypothetical protein